MLALVSSGSRPCRIGRAGVAVAPSEVRDAAQQTESLAFIGQSQFGDNIVIGTAGEVVPQPSLVKFAKGQICFSGVNDLGARIDPRLNRIRFDQRLRKAVDRAANHLVEQSARSLEIGLLLRRERLSETRFRDPAGQRPPQAQRRSG